MVNGEASGKRSAGCLLFALCNVWSFAGIAIDGPYISIGKVVIGKDAIDSLVKDYPPAGQVIRKESADGWDYWLVKGSSCSLTVNWQVVDGKRTTRRLALDPLSKHQRQELASTGKPIVASILGALGRALPGTKYVLAAKALTSEFGSGVEERSCVRWYWTPGNSSEFSYSVDLYKSNGLVSQLTLTCMPRYDRVDSVVFRSVQDFLPSGRRHFATVFQDSAEEVAPRCDQ